MGKFVNNKVFGKNLKEARIILNLSQEEFSKPLGITSGSISGYESGKAGPSKSVFNKIIEIYKIEPDFLMYGVGEIFQ